VSSTSFLHLLLGLCWSSSSVRQRPSYWSWFISDNVFQNLLGYVETIEFAVDVGTVGGSLINFLTNNITGIWVSVRAVPACMFLYYVASTFLKELSSYDSVLLFVCDQILHFVSVLHLSELGSNRCWLVSHKILQSTKGDILTEERAHDCGIALLGKLGGNRSWLISDQVLEGTKSNVLSEKRAHDGGVGLLSELGGDWSWLVSDEVLQGTKGDVLTKERRHDGRVRLLGKLGGDWSWLVSDEVLQGTKGDVLTKERRHDG